VENKNARNYWRKIEPLKNVIPSEARFFLSFNNILSEKNKAGKLNVKSKAWKAKRRIYCKI
jgi:hypothetical protein